MYPCEHSHNVYNASNTAASNQETLPHARRTIYEDNLLSSVMTEQTIIQLALGSTEMFDGSNSKYEAWTESIKMQCKQQVKIQYA